MNSRSQQVAAQVAFVTFATLWAFNDLSAPVSSGPKHALAPLAMLAISIGVSIIAGYLLRGKSENPVRDERPSPLAT